MTKTLKSCLWSDVDGHISFKLCMLFVPLGMKFGTILNDLSLYSRTQRHEVSNTFEMLSYNEGDCIEML